jgi:hypothetical protein
MQIERGPKGIGGYSSRRNTTSHENARFRINVPRKGFGFCAVCSWNFRLRIWGHLNRHSHDCMVATARWHRHIGAAIYMMWGWPPLR